jgi:hypothetical protein
MFNVSSAVIIAVFRSEGWDEIMNENTGKVKAIKYAFFFDECATHKISIIRIGSNK